MITLNLTAKGTEQELIKKYLEENASESLAEKINNGVRIEKDGKSLINRKTLDGFMKFANEEARKLAAKGANCACIEDKVVYGWAIHYFEEESIIGTLYNEDGTEYKATRPQKSAITAPAKTSAPAPKPKTESGQLSLFDFSDDIAQADDYEDKDENAVETVIEAEDTDDEDVDEQEDTEDKDEPVTAKLSPIYERYINFKNKYPDNIISLRVGDFYEIFGDDAKAVASLLELTLVGRDVGLEERLPMVGYPYHREEVYRAKLQDNYDVVVVENETDITIYRKNEVDTPSYTVNVETGEIIDSTSSGDDLLKTIISLFNGDLEVHTK